MSIINRRNFLYASSLTAALAATGTIPSAAKAQAPNAASQMAAPKKNKPPLFEISLAEWSLHKEIKGGKITNLDFAKTAKREFGINAVEYVSQLFSDKKAGSKYIAEVKKRAADEGVKNLLIMIDREGHLGDSDEKKRKQSIENHYKWVEAAKELGCHSIRVNAASNRKLSPAEQQKLAADGLRRLTEFAASYKINVIVENHGGLSSNGKWLAGVMKQVNHLRCGTLPDFGNFAIDRKKDIWYDFYQGVEELMPYAKAASAKFWDFPEEKGKELSTFDVRTKKGFDYFKMMKIVLDAGYDGYVGIEYEGTKIEEREGIRRSKKVLTDVREMMTMLKYGC